MKETINHNGWQIEIAPVRGVLNSVRIVNVLTGIALDITALVGAVIVEAHARYLGQRFCDLPHDILFALAQGQRQAMATHAMLNAGVNLEHSNLASIMPKDAKALAVRKALAEVLGQAWETDIGKAVDTAQSDSPLVKA